MHVSPISFDHFNALQDADAHDRIRAAKAKLGSRVVLLVHHYQRADVYQHRDLTGDSLKLSRLASQTDAEYIVFCGVHFMAEVADILSKPEQIAILPDLAAGCSMADMASLAKVERSWRELKEVLDDPDHQVTPVTYICCRPQSLLWSAWRHRMHFFQRAQDPGVELCPTGEDSVLSRSAPRTLVGPQDGHPAGSDAGLGP